MGSIRVTRFAPVLVVSADGSSNIVKGCAVCRQPVADHPFYGKVHSNHTAERPCQMLQLLVRGARA